LEEVALGEALVAAAQALAFGGEEEADLSKPAVGEVVGKEDGGATPVSEEVGESAVGEGEVGEVEAPAVEAALDGGFGGSEGEQIGAVSGRDVVDGPEALAAEEMKAGRGLGIEGGRPEGALDAQGGAQEGVLGQVVWAVGDEGAADLVEAGVWGRRAWFVG
jgi:hypothetical protein